MPTSEEDWTALLSRLDAEGAWPEPTSWCRRHDDARAVGSAATKPGGLLAIRALFRALEARNEPGHALRCAYVMDAAGRDEHRPQHDAVAGMARSLLTLNHRFELLTLRHDIADPGMLAAAVAAELAAEGNACGHEIALWNGVRHQRRVCAAPLVADARPLPLRDGGAVLITGGAGKLGLVLAGAPGAAPSRTTAAERALCPAGRRPAGGDRRDACGRRRGSLLPRRHRRRGRRRRPRRRRAASLRRVERRRPLRRRRRRQVAARARPRRLREPLCGEGRRRMAARRGDRRRAARLLRPLLVGVGGPRRPRRGRLRPRQPGPGQPPRHARGAAPRPHAQRPDGRDRVAAVGRRRHGDHGRQRVGLRPVGHDTCWRPPPA